MEDCKKNAHMEEGGVTNKEKFADIFYGWPLIYTIEEVGRICITPQTYLRS